MPDRNEWITLVVLVLCVPLQYYVNSYWGSTENTRSYAISQLVKNIANWQKKWFQWESLKQRLFQQSGEVDGSQWESSDESPALEVFQHNGMKGLFGTSSEPRTIRPPHLTCRVGQVVKHKLWGYKGVIVGWDLKAKAPQFWKDALKHSQHEPNYAILVDTRDRPTPQMTYVPQDNIEVIRNAQVLHPLLDDYFEHYDGAQYLPRPWVKHIYPKD